MQTTIESPADISKKDFLLFKLCNSSDNWSQRPAFYLLKNYILPRYGTADEYDLQIIDRKCRTCDGTGYYIPGDPCWHCNKGIYTTDRIALSRFILNGELFHLPECKVDVNGRSIGVGKPFLFRNTIQGLVKHKPLHDQPEYKYMKDPSFAYYVLLSKYDHDKFLFTTMQWAESLNTRAKHNFLEALKRHPDSTLDGIAEYMNINPDYYRERTGPF